MWCECVCVRVRTVNGRAAGERCRCRCSASRGGRGLLFAGSEAWSVSLLTCLLAYAAGLKQARGQARPGWGWFWPLAFPSTPGIKSSDGQLFQPTATARACRPACICSLSGPGTPYSYIPFYTTHARCTHDARCRLKNAEGRKQSRSLLSASLSLSLSSAAQVASLARPVSLPPNRAKAFLNSSS